MLDQHLYATSWYFKVIPRIYGQMTNVNILQTFKILLTQHVCVVFVYDSNSDSPVALGR